MNYSVSFRRIFGTKLSNEKMAELLHFVEKIKNNDKREFVRV
jgi:hypothetical protein